MTMTHADLVVRGERWLKQNGCGVTFHELVTSCPETPDAIGWRSGTSILVECKTSRADFFADHKKWFRVKPEYGMGDWRFFLCPQGVITQADLPPGWGLLYALEKTIAKVHGVPKGNCHWGLAPFVGNKRNELAMMTSAVRRLSLRGHLNEIYESPFDPKLK